MDPPIHRPAVDHLEGLALDCGDHVVGVLRVEQQPRDVDDDVQQRGEDVKFVIGTATARPHLGPVWGGSTGEEILGGSGECTVSDMILRLHILAHTIRHIR